MKFVALRENIKMPQRATAGSAGYDLYAPDNIVLQPKAEYVVNTGLAAEIDDGYFGLIVPRSGLGFKMGVHLKNTVGIIDSDYIMADNGGHIAVKLVNPSPCTVEIAKGSAFAQFIFLAYGRTDDDNATAKRTGGFGSTDKK